MDKMYLTYRKSNTNYVPNEYKTHEEDSCCLKALVKLTCYGGFAVTLGRVERLQIMLTEDELSALDDWRFVRRMPSRAAAIREILKRGLAGEGFVLADKAVKSKDFGILAKQKAKPTKRD
jgi:hypothetical protein